MRKLMLLLVVLAVVYWSRRLYTRKLVHPLQAIGEYRSAWV